MYEDILVKSKKKKEKKEKKKSSNVEVTLRYLPRSLSKKKKKINQGRTEIGQVSKVLWKTLK